MTQDVQEPDAAALVSFLRDRDVFCPLCRYNLRGLTSARCPECGRELRLSIGLTEPFLRAWITLAAGAFSSSAIGLLMAWVLFREGWPPNPSETLLKISLVIYLLMIPAAPVVLATRRRFLRLTNMLQWRIAVGVVVVSLAAFIILLSSVG